MAATRSIDVSGPDESGEFIATLPNGDVRRITTGAELDTLMQEWAVLVKKGDFHRLRRRTEPG
jgi:hypothetical protein